MVAAETRFQLFRSPSAREREGLTVRSIGHVLYRPPTACVRPDGWHVDVLVYTVAGRARGEVAGERSIADAGSLWLHPMDRGYRFDIDPQIGYWEGRWIEVEGTWLRPLMQRLGLAGVSHIPGCSAAAGPIEDLFDRFRADGDAADHEAAALVWRVLAIAECMTLRKRPRVDPNALAIERARDFARRRLDQDIGLADLAHAAGLSPFHFARVFKTRTGSSPIDWLRGARIARAQELLLGGDDIKRVARAVGYGSVAHFTTAFARRIGCAPGAFRDRMRGG